MNKDSLTLTREQRVMVETRDVALEGDLRTPPDASAIVVFAHGSGSSRRSPRNRYVASFLNKAGIATLLFDLLTPKEEDLDLISREYRFDIDLLSMRLSGASDWIRTQDRLRDMQLGYFGASTGAAAALVAAAGRQDVAAVVSRGGRPDLAGAALERTVVPTLLIGGGNDPVVLDLNREAYARLATEAKDLIIIAGATHLFEEQGALDEVAHRAADWFERFLLRNT
ncbi:MAG: dienelactone hydrolase family protein [Chitinivibrionales bacterium]